MEKNRAFTLCYKSDMQCLFQLLLNREKNVVEVHKLFGRMFNVIWYRRQFKKATEVSECKRILDSVVSAENDLRELLQTWCLSENDKKLIWSLTLKTI